MNPRLNPDHKICGLVAPSLRKPQRANSSDQRPSEAGYTMVALLALMTVLALLAVAAAPSVKQQAQREREKEAIFRGEQVAAAIRSYYLHSLSTRGAGDQSLPTSIDQLLEGIPVPGGSKKRQILRFSAARDPLSTSGEWRLVAPRSQSLVDFQRAVILYAGNSVPAPREAQLVQLQQLAVPQLTSVLGTESSSPPSLEAGSSESSGPFVGVSSRSSNNSVLYYYGIDRHDRWIFTPLFR